MVKGIGAAAVLIAVLGTLATDVMPSSIRIPAGSFVRSDDRLVRVSAFPIAPYELTQGQYGRVRGWALGNGYGVAAGFVESEAYPGDL